MGPYVSTGEEDEEEEEEEAAVTNGISSSPHTGLDSKVTKKRERERQEREES